MEPDTQPTLRAVFTVFEQKKTLPPELRLHPVLVHFGQAGDQAGARGFETKALMAPWDVRVALVLVNSGSEADPQLLTQAGSVWPVAKRPGGPFPDRIGVGRTRTADISLRMGSVSKYHAYFIYNDAERRWEVWDARSRNGTWVGDRRLPSGSGAPVENCTQLSFGDEAFLFFTEPGFRALVEALAKTGPGRP